MLEHDSRYYDIETATIKAPDGSLISYKKRRFLPDGKKMETHSEITVTEGERLDLIAAKTYGDPEQFWRICDANDAMNPFDLTRTIGAKLKIASPQMSISV